MRSFCLLLFLFLTASVKGQTLASSPYLVAATINLSVNNDADVWLNGTHLGHYKHNDASTAYRIIEARPDSLCYFKKENVLAVSVQAAKSVGKERYIGVAYFMFLRFSDGSTQVLDSSDAGEHRSFYIPHREVEEPLSWQSLEFDDTGWTAAQSTGDRIPETGNLIGGNFGKPVGFLSATPDGYFAKYAGEKQLFRRRFHLDIGTNPRCWPRSVAPLVPRKVRPNKFSSLTPVVLPAHKQPLASAPELSLPRPGIKKRLVPPTWTPTVQLMTPTPTATLWIQPMATFTPVPFATVPIVATATSTPYLVPTMIVQDDGAIVFSQNTANILAVFGDGPGFYKVEAVDDKMAHLKTLLNQRIMNPSETWLSWDGKTDAGQDVPEGTYYILCSKEGVVLQKIILRRVSQ